MALRIRLRLGEALKKRNLSLYRLHKDLIKAGHSITYRTLLAWRDNETRALNLEHLAAICSALNCPLTELLTSEK